MTAISLETLQLEEGSTATEYEPPAPTPDYPIEIHSLNDFDVVSSVGGRNYWVNSLMWDIGNYERIGPYDYYTVSGLKPNTEYTMSINPEIDLDSIPKPTSGNRALRINNKKENPSLNVLNALSDRVETFERTVTSTEDGILYILNYSILQSGIGDLNPKGIILKESSVIQDWTPAPEDITESNNHPLIDKINLLLDEPLRSVGDVKDRLFRDSDGLWKVERNVYYEELDSNTPNWSSYAYYNRDNAISTRVIRSQHRQSLTWSEFRSSHFPEVSVAWTRNEAGIGYSSADGTSVWIQIPKNIANNLEEAKLWADRQKAQGTPIQIMYPLKENKYIETLDQELQDKLNNLRSFQDSNYVYTVLDKTDILPTVAENLKPTLHAKFLYNNWYKEDRVINNLMIYNRALTNEEMLQNYKTIKRRWGM